MPKIYTSKEVIKKLQKLGFIEDRQSRSHKVFYHPVTQTRAVIPFHLKELPKGTFAAILRESKITRGEFDKA